MAQPGREVVDPMRDKHDSRDDGLPSGFPAPGRAYALYEDVAYNKHWEGASQGRLDALERHIVGSMLPQSGQRILDLGGGYGRLSSVYKNRFDDIVLLDGSMSLLMEARRLLGGQATLIAGDIGSLPFKTSCFDCVLTIRVLQHVTDLPRVLGEMRRILSGRGSLVFSYHNKRNAHRVLHYLDSRKKGDPFSLDSEEISPTLISHHPERFDRLLQDAGFGPARYEGTAVVDAWAAVMERLGSRSTPGAAWAPAMGRLRLAPWLIGCASAPGTTVVQHADSVEDLLACPQCRGGLVRIGSTFECRRCSLTYPLVDDIVDFRVSAGSLEEGHAPSPAANTQYSPLVGARS